MINVDIVNMPFGNGTMDVKHGNTHEVYKMQHRRSP